jgi:hypothetical protein
MWARLGPQDTRAGHETLSDAIFAKDIELFLAAYISSKVHKLTIEAAE